MKRVLRKPARSINKIKSVATISQKTRLNGLEDEKGLKSDTIEFAEQSSGYEGSMEVEIAFLNQRLAMIQDMVSLCKQELSTIVKLPQNNGKKNHLTARETQIMDLLK